MPSSMPYGVSGVSGLQSVIELPFVKTLLRSVPLVCSKLDLDDNPELSLARNGSSPKNSVAPFGVDRGNASGNPVNDGSIGSRS